MLLLGIGLLALLALWAAWDSPVHDEKDAESWDHIDWD